MLKSDAESIKQAIRDLVNRSGGGVSFVELENIPGFSGNLEIGPAGYNILYWQGISEAGMQALIELQEDNDVIKCPTTALVYFVDGKGLRLPVAEKFRNYRRLHWMPVTFWTPAQLEAEMARKKAGPKRSSKKSRQAAVEG